MCPAEGSSLGIIAQEHGYFDGGVMSKILHNRPGIGAAAGGKNRDPELCIFFHEIFQLQGIKIQGHRLHRFSQIFRLGVCYICEGAKKV